MHAGVPAGVGSGRKQRTADSETDHDNIPSKSVRVGLVVRPSEIKLYFQYYAFGLWC